MPSRKPWTWDQHLKVSQHLSDISRLFMQIAEMPDNYAPIIDEALKFRDKVRHLRYLCDKRARRDLAEEYSDSIYYPREQEKVVEFKMLLEPHIPNYPSSAAQAGAPCDQCALQSGPCCLDRSYCKYHETGLTWKKHLPEE